MHNRNGKKIFLSFRSIQERKEDEKRTERERYWFFFKFFFFQRPDEPAVFVPEVARQHKVMKRIFRIFVASYNWITKSGSFKIAQRALKINLQLFLP